MARPIKETPILFGEDARRFEERMRENHKVSTEEMERIQKNYELALDMLARGKNLKLKTKPITQDEIDAILNK